MIYYTLTSKGKAWLDNEVPDPPKYKHVLASIAELIEESDTPRIAIQVAHVSNIPEEQALSGLKYLTTEGYVAQAKPPQPREEPLAKIRIRSIEDIVAAELRVIEAQKKYALSAGGKAVHAKYESGDLGRSKNKRYRESEKGKTAHKRYRLNRRLKELTNFLTTNPDKAEELKPLIADTIARLANLPSKKSDEDEE